MVILLSEDLKYVQVQIFSLMNEAMLGAICERLKLKRYMMGSKILSERGFVEKMIFVVCGTLESVAADETRILSVGDACGLELLASYLDPDSVRTGLPILDYNDHHFLSKLQGSIVINS